MDADLVLIFGFVLVALTIIGLSINGLVGKVLAHKRWEKEAALTGSRNAAGVGEIADRTDLIEDRLRVLERLATDRGQLLSDEIDALRDAQPNLAAPANSKDDAK